MNNIFVEGIQGAGKSTLLNELQRNMPDYRVYREGDYSPVELAWCSYMTEQQYEEICVSYQEIAPEIEAHTVTEGNQKITAYTQILTDVQGFHKFMEQYEIYNGNVDFHEFKKIICKRYEALREFGNIFECSFFQNSIECMMLFYQMSEEAIIEFYIEVFDILKAKQFRLLYLEVQDIGTTIDKIRRERTDERGNEIWFLLMLQYLENSPYGKAHNLKGFEGLVSHLKRRSEIEKRVMERIVGENTLIIEAKSYDMKEIIAWCKQ